MMNVLNLPKQSDHELVYSYHAIERAIERDVPMPKYIPFGAKCISKRRVMGSLRYKLSYTYNDVEYFMVVSDNQMVMTVYAFEDRTTSVSIAKIHEKMNADMVVSDTLICMEYEVDYYANQSYA